MSDAENSTSQPVVDKTDLLQHESVKFECPLVFQCSKCRSIIGDSLAWVGAYEDLSAVVLHHVSDSAIRTRRDRVTSQNAFDLGSTFLILECQVCDELIGRIYKTTPKHLDDIRDCYCLDVKQVDSYQLGDFGTNVTRESDPFSMQTNTYLVSQINKFQSIIVGLGERVAALEQSVFPQGCGDNESFDSESPLTNSSQLGKAQKRTWVNANDSSKKSSKPL